MPTFEELVRLATAIDEATKPMIVICPVGRGLQVEALVLRYGMDQYWTVRESAHCEDKIFLISDPGDLT